MNVLDIKLTNRPPAIIVVMETAALTTASPRDSAMALKPIWKPEKWDY